jgi:hypothetical protein
MTEQTTFKPGDLAIYQKGSVDEAVVEVIGPCSVFGTLMYQIAKLPLGSGLDYVETRKLSKLSSDLFADLPKNLVAAPEPTVLICECGQDKVGPGRHSEWCPKHTKDNV